MLLALEKGYDVRLRGAYPSCSDARRLHVIEQDEKSGIQRVVAYYYVALRLKGQKKSDKSRKRRRLKSSTSTFKFACLKACEWSTSSTLLDASL